MPAPSYYSQDELDEILGRKTSVLPGLFDVLSRPSRAITEGTIRALEGEGVGGFASGLGAGLSGSTYRTGRDLFDVAFGEDTNDQLASVVGFGWDVLADPTTYLGTKTVRPRTTDIGRRATAAKVFDELQQARGTALKKNVPLSLGESRSKFADLPLAPYENLTKFDTAVEKISQDLKDLDPGRVYMTFMGKPIGKGSTELYSKVAGGAEKVFMKPDIPGATGAGSARSLAEMFNTKAELPGGLYQVKRRAETRSVAALQEQKMVFAKIANLFDADDRKTMSFALDNPEFDKSVDLRSVLAKENDLGIVNAEDARKILRSTLDDSFKHLVDLGVMRPQQYREYYTHHVFNGDAKLDKRGARVYRVKISGPKSAPFMMKRSRDISLYEASVNNLDPVTDWADWLPIYMADYYRTVHKAETYLGAMEQFGIRATKANKKWLNENNYVPVVGNLDHPIMENKKKQFQNLYMHKSQTQALEKTMAVIDNDALAAKAMRLYDRVLNEFRFYATLTPMTRSRNLQSDIINNASAGVWDISTYKRSIRTLRNRNAALLHDLFPESPAPLNDTVKIGGRKMLILDLWELYSRSGAKSGNIASMLGADLQSLPAHLTDKSRRKGMVRELTRANAQVKKFAGKLADDQEDMVRLAHFIDFLDKNAKDIPLEKDAITGTFSQRTLDLAQEAGDKVRGFNLDYGNKTAFERNVMSRMIPFYSYLRQALPVQVALLFARPGFMALYPKGQNLITNLMGAEDEDPYDNEEVPNLLMGYAKELAPFRIAAGYQEQNRESELDKLLNAMGPVGAAARAGFGLEPGGQAIITNQGLPVDVLRLLEPVNFGAQAVARGEMPTPSETVGEFFNQALSSSAPMIKTPVELGTGKSPFSGADTSAYGWGKWIAGQLPQTRIPYNVATGKTNSGEIGRFLTGIDIRPVTDKSRMSEALSQIDEIDKALASFDRSKYRGQWVYSDLDAYELKKRRASLQAFVNSMAEEPWERGTRYYLGDRK